MAAFFLSARPDNIFLVKRRAQRSLVSLPNDRPYKKWWSPLLLNSKPQSIRFFPSSHSFSTFRRLPSSSVPSIWYPLVSSYIIYVTQRLQPIMSPSIRTLALGVISFSPFVTAWPRTCLASCVMTVTATVTETAPCSAVLSASATSSVETSMADSTSNSTYEHRTHHHHHTPVSAPWAMNSTTMAFASSNTIQPSSGFSPASSTAIIATSSAEQNGSSLLTQLTTTLAPTTSGHLPTSAPTLSPNNCQPDNCLRDFIRHPEVAGFCATYTTQINTVTTGLPDLVSQCNYNPTSISSACSCVATAVPTSTLTPPANDCQHDNCLRHFIRHPEATGFCAAYTEELNTATTGLPDLASQCQYNPTRISSACSCVVTGHSSPSLLITSQATAANNGTYITMTSSGPVITSSASTSDICLDPTITFETTTLLVTIVSTISLESSKSTAESSMISATVTSHATLSYSTIITSTETDVAASSDMAASTSSVHHRHRHGDLGGWFA
jgi:hypothetical protein